MRQAGWRWGTVLTFALFAPVALPAGGADRRQPEVRRRTSGEPLIPAGCLSLLLAPQQEAPQLVRLQTDTPLRVLRSWRSERGEQWLQVEAGERRRGWLVVA
jgi:hypothetical protein